jgi:hypothetical protein
LAKFGKLRPELQHTPLVKLFAYLQRAWKGHDEKLAQRAYADRAGVERLEGLNDQLETTEVVGKVYGAPGFDLGMSKAIREDDALEHAHPPDESE